jgi:ATP-dependent DNA ligase
MRYSGRRRSLEKLPALVFAHACRMGVEAIVSKRIDAPYRSGPP